MPIWSPETAVLPELAEQEILRLPLLGTIRWLLPQTVRFCLFASSSVPARAASPELGAPAKDGIWKGISLECFDKTLAFYQTGNWNNMLSSTPLSAASADVARFKLNNTAGDFTVTLGDVDSLGIFVKTATESVDLNRPEMLLSLRVIMIKPNSGGKVKITEEITAKISDRKASEIVSGAASYKVSKRRK